jgi:hypothetical protein
MHFYFFSYALDFGPAFCKISNKLLLIWRGWLSQFNRKGLVKKSPIKAGTELAGKILHMLSVPTFAIDTNKSNTHWNSALERSSGVESSQVIGAGNYWRAFYEKKRPLMADLIVGQRARSDYLKFLRWENP